MKKFNIVASVVFGSLLTMMIVLCSLKI